MSQFRLALGRARGRQLETTPAREAVRTAKRRLVAAAMITLVGFGGTAWRAVDLATAANPATIALEAPQPAPRRGSIRDRNGTLLATSVPGVSLFADATAVDDPVAAADRLTEIVGGLDHGRLVERLSSDQRFVWIGRGITPDQQYRINRLGIPGLDFEKESRRLYPTGALMGHVVGLADVDGVGVAGIERRFDGVLGADGADVTLSIDVRIQQIMRGELAAAIDRFNAIGGAGVVQDIRTGELLAMVSLPDFDPHDRLGGDEAGRFNRASLGAYEMGSTFKIFNTAIALDTGVTDITGSFDATGPLKYGRYTIRDYRPERRWLTVAEIFTHSSNIGSALMALDFGGTVQQDYLARLGLMSPLPLELPEVARPLFPASWRDINTMTIAFGHGIAVSPVHLTSAVAAVVNGGIYRPPTLLAGGGQPQGQPAISPRTSARLRELLRLNVLEGSGREADAAGYLVGGKTGTAEKLGPDGYLDNARVSSFVAAFPIDDPRFVVFVMLDEPHGTPQTHGFATGGWVSAPSVRQIIERMAPMLGIAPRPGAEPDLGQPVGLETTRGPGAPAPALVVAN